MNNGPGGTWWWTALGPERAARRLPRLRRFAPLSVRLRDREQVGRLLERRVVRHLRRRARLRAAAHRRRRLHRRRGPPPGRGRGGGSRGGHPHSAGRPTYRLSLLWTRGGCSSHNICDAAAPVEREQLPGRAGRLPVVRRGDGKGAPPPPPPPLAAALAAARRRAAAAQPAAPAAPRRPPAAPPWPAGAPPQHADRDAHEYRRGDGPPTLTLAHDTDCDSQVRRPFARSLRRSLRAPLAHAHPLPVRLPALPPRLRRRVLVRHRPEGVPPALPAGAELLHRGDRRRRRLRLYGRRDRRGDAAAAGAVRDGGDVVRSGASQRDGAVRKLHNRRKAAAPSHVGRAAARRPPLAVHPPRRCAVHVSGRLVLARPHRRGPELPRAVRRLLHRQLRRDLAARSRAVQRNGRQHGAAVRVAPQVAPQPVPRRGRPFGPHGDVRLRDGHRRGHASGDARRAPNLLRARRKPPSNLTPPRDHGVVHRQRAQRRVERVRLREGLRGEVSALPGRVHLQGQRDAAVRIDR